MSQPARRRAARRYFYTRRDGKQNQPVLYVRDGVDGDRPRAGRRQRAERADGTRALDWWFPSDDGALVAYGVSADGSEESTLRVRDVATGQDLPDEITARARLLAGLDARRQGLLLHALPGAGRGARRRG